MPNRTTTFLGAILVLALPLSAAAQLPDMAINLRAGTSGIAPGVTVGLLRTLNLRVEVPVLQYAYEGTQTFEVEGGDPIELGLTGEADFVAVAAIADYHPWAGRFRLSGGVLYNQMKARFDGAALSAMTVGEVTFSAEQIGGLSGDMQLGRDIAPYVGLGFGNPVAPGKRLGFTLDMGAIFSGPPSLEMEGRGMIGPTAEEAPVLESNLDWIYAFPLVAVGLSYRVF